MKVYVECAGKGERVRGRAFTVSEGAKNSPDWNNPYIKVHLILGEYQQGEGGYLDTRFINLDRAGEGGIWEGTAPLKGLKFRIEDIAITGRALSGDEQNELDFPAPKKRRLMVNYEVYPMAAGDGVALGGAALVGANQWGARGGGGGADNAGAGGGGGGADNAGGQANPWVALAGGGGADNAGGQANPPNYYVQYDVDIDQMLARVQRVVQAPAPIPVVAPVDPFEEENEGDDL